MTGSSSNSIEKRVEQTKNIYFIWVLPLSLIHLQHIAPGWGHKIVFYIILLIYIFILNCIFMSNAVNSIIIMMINKDKTFKKYLISWLWTCLFSFVLWFPFVGLVFGIGLLPNTDLLIIISRQIAASCIVPTIFWGLLQLNKA